MADEEHEITYEDHQIIEEIEQNIRNNDEECKPKRSHKSLTELRQPRQKFCPRWQIEFPWLKSNRIDESIGYCIICRKELVCKKSHLVRHQRSFKHMRLQGFENVYTVNEPEAELIEAHTSGYLDNVNDQDLQVEEILDDLDEEFTTIKVEPTRATQVYVKAKYNTNLLPKKRISVKNESPAMLERSVPVHNSHIGSAEHNRGNFYCSTPLFPAPSKKDSFDLFFESISASVKNLPPKLGAEVKSKVSQVIAEFELRAICEKEAQENAQQTVVTLPTQVTSVIAVDPTVNSEVTVNSEQAVNGTGVTHYVYAYQEKLQE